MIPDTEFLFVIHQYLATMRKKVHGQEVPSPPFTLQCIYKRDILDWGGVPPDRGKVTVIKYSQISVKIQRINYSPSGAFK